MGKKKPQKMDDDEMDVEAASVICLNLSDKVIHNVIDEEKSESILKKNLTNRLYVKK